MLLGTIQHSIISIIQAGVQTLADGESAIYTQRERASAIFIGVYPRDPHDPCWCKEQPQWPNMLAHVRMEITSALDGADANVTTSQELQQKYLQISDISLSKMIVRQWRRNRAVLSSSSEEMLKSRACLIHGNPVLTHVGSLSLHCDIVNMYSYELEEDIKGGYCTMSDGFVLPVFCIREVLPGVKRVRKELSWGRSETVEKKAEEGRRGRRCRDIKCTTPRYSGVRKERATRRLKCTASRRLMNSSIKCYFNKSSTNCYPNERPLNSQKRMLQ
jgi:hypothetical protein